MPNSVDYARNALDDATLIAAGIRAQGGYVRPRDDTTEELINYLNWRDPQTGQARPGGSPFPSTDPTGAIGRYYLAGQPTGLSVDTMRPDLRWRDPNFVPVQPQGNALMPFIPTASNVSDWLTGPPGSPQATDDPAYVRRLQGTIPLPGVRYATPQEAHQNLLNNAPILARILNRLDPQQ